MKKQVIVATDSGANLPQTLIEKYDIQVIPLWVQIGERSYRDGVDIQPMEFFRRLREKVGRMATSQPSLGEFLEFYRGLRERAEGVVAVHLVGRYSGVLSVARAAAVELAPFPIEVIDSGNIAMAEGFAVLVAARAAQAGASLREVVERVKAVIPRIDLVAMVDSLEYAVRGGRLASAARLLDNLLNIKPLVRVHNSDLGIIGQVRTRAKGLRRMAEELAEKVGDAPCHVAVLYSDAVEEAERLRDEIVARLRCVEVHFLPVAPVLGVHAGPGAVGLAFYAGE